MNFHPYMFSRFFLSLSLLALLFACAPQNGGPESEDEPTEVVAAATPSVENRSDVEIPEPAEDTEGEMILVEKPDWEKRFQELYAKYAEEFTGPETSDAVKLELKDGSHQAGWVHRIADDEIVLDTGAGYSGFRLEDLSEASAMATLRSVYAQKHAYDQSRKEYEAWKKENPQAVQPPPTPEPTPRPTPLPEPVSEEPNNNNEFPFVVEPSGRVPHVEDYIRKNAAFPDSLHVRTWWPVKPHNRGGYQVRVRYTLKSAGNLGTSYEDMIFFMYSNGRIHQRAPVK